MKIRHHAKNTKKLCGEKAKDIHKWIDSHFDKMKFQVVLETGNMNYYNPFSHRQHKHNKEALSEIVEVFKHKYSPEIIECVFLQHLRDDYQGHIPCKADFDDPEFIAKYHPWNIPVKTQ